MYYISPSVLYKKSNLNLQVGIRPSWDNKSFKMFPNILADIGTEDQRFTFQAGWTGYLQKNNLSIFSFTKSMAMDAGYFAKYKDRRTFCRV